MQTVLARSLHTLLTGGIVYQWLAILVLLSSVSSWGDPPGTNPDHGTDALKKKIQERREAEKDNPLTASVDPTLAAFLELAEIDTAQLADKKKEYIDYFAKLAKGEKEAKDFFDLALTDKEKAELTAIATNGDYALQFFQDISNQKDEEGNFPKDFIKKLNELIELLKNDGESPDETPESEKKKTNPGPVPKGDGDDDDDEEDLEEATPTRTGGPAATAPPGLGGPAGTEDPFETDEDDAFTPSAINPGAGSGSPGAGLGSGSTDPNQQGQIPQGGQGSGAQYKNNEAKLEPSKVPEPGQIPPPLSLEMAKDQPISDDMAAKLGAQPRSDRNFDYVSSLEKQIRDSAATQLEINSKRTLTTGYSILNSRVPPPNYRPATPVTRYTFSQALRMGGSTSRLNRLRQSQQTTTTSLRVPAGRTRQTPLGIRTFKRAGPKASRLLKPKRVEPVR